MREDDAKLVIEAVEGAARIYAKRNADRKRVLDYHRRRKRLMWMSRYAGDIANVIEGMDVMFKDILTTAYGESESLKFISDLKNFASCCARIASTTQKTGKPRDIIEESWIVSIRSIYANFFADAGRDLHMADFQRFLRLCRPRDFRGGVGRDNGALTPRQIERALNRKQTKKKDLRIIFPDHMKI